MNLRLLATLTVASFAIATAKVVYVKPGGSGNGSSWTTAAGTVQAGLNAAVPGDEVWVASGTYPERIVLKSGVGLYGGLSGSEDQREQRDPASNVSILDGQAKGSVVTAGSDVTQQAVIDGFTIQNGGGSFGGGGINSNGAVLLISNNVITGNTAGVGGGIYFYSGSVHVQHNKITNNTSNTNGGDDGNVGSAIYGLSGGDVDGNIISNNTMEQAPFGAYTVWLADGPFSFSDNIVSSNDDDVTLYTAVAIVSGNVISDNGGGISLSGEKNTSSILEDNLVINSGYGIGAGGGAVLVTRNVLSGNRRYGV